MACGLSLFASCSDFLDVKPVGKLIPTEVEEFENILNNVSTINYQLMDNNGGSLFATLGDNVKIGENSAKYEYVATHANIYRFTAYTYKLPYMNPEKPCFFWENGTYLATGLFNNVIDGVESVRTEKTNALANQVTAQAKAGRAWAYLTMGLAYGPMYVPGGANTEKTIPYRIAGDANTPNPALATTAELFSLAKKDLEDALKYAPATVANPTRANLAAVQALMAYYYMFTRDFEKMYEYSNLAWSSALAQKGSVDKLIYDYNQFRYEPNPSAKPSPGTDVEVSLEMKGPDTDMKESYHRENLFYRIAANNTGGYPSDEFIELFDKNKDVRYKLWVLKTLGYSKIVGGVKYDDGIVFGYYKGNKMNINQGITYPELLLMRAEAAARTNKLSLALTDLNTLRHYRYDNKSGSSTDLENGASFTQDQLLEEILKERRRELPIASFQRLLDLKRFALDAGKPWSKTTIEHKIGNQVYSASINSEYFIMPIPNNIIDLNPQWGLQKDMRPYNPR